MKKKFNKIYVPLAALCSLCLLAASCLSDDYDTETVSAGAPSIRLYITANGMGDLNATRTDYNPGDETGETEAGESGEFINSLCVFVVDNTSHKIEYKFISSTDGFGSDQTAAADGNLLAHSISLTKSDGSFVNNYLTVGPKTIYAFANWEKTTEGQGTGKWLALINKAADGSTTITDEDLTFYVTDPAGTIDFDNGGYIPMSGKITATISEDLNYSSQLITVGLDRLVSKVRLSVLPETIQTEDSSGGAGDSSKGTKTETRSSEPYTCVEISELKFSNGADKVALFSDKDPGGTINYTKVYQVSDMKELNESLWSNNVCTIANEDNPVAKDIAEFYINETELPGSPNGPDGFDVVLNTERNGTGGYNYYSTGVSQVTSVLRNRIYPLELTLDVVTIDFSESKVNFAGIGLEELQYFNWNEAPDGTYVLELLEVTSSVELTPKLKFSDGTTATNITWELTLNALAKNGGDVVTGVGDQLVIRTVESGNYVYTATSLKIGNNATNTTDQNATSFYITHFTANEYDEYNQAKLSVEWYDSNKYKHTRSFMIRFSIVLDEAPQYNQSKKAPLSPWILTQKNIAPLRPLTRRLD